MTQIIILIIVIAIVVILLSRKSRPDLRTGLRRGKDKFVGICSVAIGLDAKKQERKEKILTLLADKGELSNSDIRDALGVSSTSVVRYIDELEKEGRVEQIGETGNAVTYRLR